MHKILNTNPILDSFFAFKLTPCFCKNPPIKYSVIKLIIPYPLSFTVTSVKKVGQIEKVTKSKKTKKFKDSDEPFIPKKKFKK